MAGKVIVPVLVILTLHVWATNDRVVDSQVVKHEKEGMLLLFHPSDTFRSQSTLIMSPKQNRSYNEYPYGFFPYQGGFVDGFSRLIVANTYFILAKGLLEKGGTLLDSALTIDDSIRRKQEVNNAIDCLNKTVDIHPGLENAWLLLGNAHYNLTNDDTIAKRYYQKALNLKPDYFSAIFNLGVIHMENDEFKEAIHYLERAVEIDPLEFSAQRALAESYMKGGQPDSAIHMFKRMIDANPDVAEFYYKLGISFARYKGELNKGVKYIKKAIEIDPENATYYEDLGVAYGMKEEYRNAIDAFQKAIDLRPNYAKIYKNLGVTYKQLGNEEKAQEYFQKAQQLQNK